MFHFNIASRVLLAVTLAIPALAILGGNDTRLAGSPFQKKLGYLPCEGNVSFLNSLDLASIYVGNERNKCVIWETVFDDFSAAAGWVTIDNHTLPVVSYYRKDSVGRSIKHIYIRIIGGPGFEIAPKRKDVFYAPAIKPDSVFITVGYTGTRYANNYPESSFSQACREIVAYTSMVKRYYPNASFSLFGESLGGPIALCVASKLSNGTVGKILLLSPLLSSPSEAELKFQGNLRFNGLPSTEVTFRKSASSSKDSEWISVSSIKLFESFFPDNEKGVSLARRVSKDVAKRTTIIYGTNDDVIGLSHLAYLSALGVGMIAVQSRGHQLIDTPLSQEQIPELITAAN